MVTDYKIIVKEPATGKIWELQPRSWRFTEKVNKEPVATFQFSFEDLEELAETTDTDVLSIFTPNLREVGIYFDNVKKYDGVITDFIVKPQDDGSRNLELRSMGFLGLFKKRIVGKGTKTIYTGTDAGAIAWDLINDSQGSDPTYSDWGITEGSITASKNRDRQYLFDVVYDSILKLTRDNVKDGFDCEIDTTRAFNVYYPYKGTTRPTIVFDEQSIHKWTYSKSLILDMVNKIYVMGEGTDESIIFAERVAATTYRDDFGTLEEKLRAENVTETATLNDKGDRELELRREPIIAIDDIEHYESVISFNDYNVGDQIKINFPDLGLSNVTKRVIEREFSMDSESIGKMRVRLGDL